MEKLIDIGSEPVAGVLDTLLRDKSTRKNIIWATDAYEEYGEGFTDTARITPRALKRHPDSICPRIQNSQQVAPLRGIHIVLYKL